MTRNLRHESHSSLGPLEGERLALLARPMALLRISQAYTFQCFLAQPSGDSLDCGPPYFHLHLAPVLDSLEPVPLPIEGQESVSFLWLDPTLQRETELCMGLC